MSCIVTFRETKGAQRCCTHTHTHIMQIEHTGIHRYTIDTTGNRSYKIQFNKESVESACIGMVSNNQSVVLSMWLYSFLKCSNERDQNCVCVWERERMHACCCWATVLMLPLVHIIAITFSTFPMYILSWKHRNWTDSSMWSEFVCMCAYLFSPDKMIISITRESFEHC